MGDRANVLVKESDNDPGVYLYTHWGGTELPIVLQNALRKRWRWDDCSYLTRIIFCEMVKGEEMDECGYGISTFAPDGQDRVLVVNCSDQTVKTQGDPHYPEWSCKEQTWTFEEYIALDIENPQELWYGKEEESHE